MGTSSFVRGSIFLTIALFVSRGAVVVASALVARWFGAEAFAVFTFVHLTATALSNIAMAGMMNGLPRFFARMAVDSSADALAQVLVSVLVVVAGLAVALMVMAMLPEDVIGLPEGGYKPVLVLLTLTIGLNNVLVGAHNGYERFEYVAISSIATGLALVIGIAGAIALGAPGAPLYFYLIASLIGLAILMPGALRIVYMRIKVDSFVVSRQAWKSVGNYLGPMVVVTVLTNSGLWIAGRTLLHEGDTAAVEFSKFAMGMQWFGLAAMASNVVSKTAMPRLVRHIFSGKPSEEKNTLRVATALAIGGAVAVLLMVLIGAPFILSFYGKELAGARWTLTIFVLAAVFSAPISVLTSKHVAAARYDVVLWSTVAWWSTLVMASVAFSRYGALAVCASVLVSYFVYLSAMRAGSRSSKVG